MRLNRALNRRWGRPLARLGFRRLDGRRARRPDPLAQASRAINRYLRERRQLARTHPHLYGRHAGRYYQDALREEQRNRLVDAALDKVYGRAAPGEPARPSVWQQRYEIPPDQMRVHRKWFRRQYGPE